jgi:agmatinase
MTGRVEIGQMFGAPPPDTFLGLPAVAPDAVKGGVAILGADTATPYASVGPYCAGGPAAIRRAIGQYAANLAHHDFDLDGQLLPPGTRAVDCGDVPVGDDAAANRDAIRAACGAILDRGGVPILLGGDDSVPIPLIEALAARGPLAILQLDAHVDWRDEVGGERWGLSSTMRRASELGVGPIVQVGQRSLGSARPGDQADAVAAGVTFVGAREVHRDGLGRAIAAIPEGGRVLVALDVDGLDPSICPAVIGPAPGGLLYWQVLELLDAVARKATLAAMNCVELVPGRDADGLSALTAARIVAYAMALAARQRAS